MHRNNKLYTVIIIIKITTFTHKAIMLITKSLKFLLIASTIREPNQKKKKHPSKYHKSKHCSF